MGITTSGTYWTYIMTLKKILSKNCVRRRKPMESSLHVWIDSELRNNVYVVCEYGLKLIRLKLPARFSSRFWFWCMA